ncbi:hypothetical protein AA0313_0767 [Acetobacter indonesiensis NRIC 0313]|uniref:Uncharacterized protein n=1 Tax=Acetobacter indonesiensis TaxID=104101 RepID=A0A6N3T3H7_9PROT|nr:hypothetical protein Abin_053_095 [Acetobacter indonesiensis]GBQ55125.1 hypothetical protein AA0313_0767 [Acetobacter indonesiensis NRIC 0313]GEN03736.1 hypothetical protein AIN02nite_17610 [Acetobacter indonesiensis]
MVRLLPLAGHIQENGHNHESPRRETETHTVFYGNHQSGRQGPGCDRYCGGCCKNGRLRP